MQFYILVVGEFMLVDLYWIVYQVWFICWFVCSFYMFVLMLFYCYFVEYIGFGRINGVGVNGLIIFWCRCMLQIGNYIYVMQVDGCGLWIFFFVDLVFVNG